MREGEARRGEAWGGVEGERRGARKGQGKQGGARCAVHVPAPRYYRYLVLPVAPRRQRRQLYLFLGRIQREYIVFKVTPYCIPHLGCEALVNSSESSTYLPTNHKQASSHSSMSSWQALTSSWEVLQASDELMGGYGQVMYL